MAGALPGVAHRATATGLMPMLGLVIVHDQTGVNHTGHPARESEEKTQDKTQEPAGHEDGNRRKSDAKKVTKRFQLRERSREPRPSAINDCLRSGSQRRFSPGQVRSATRRSCATPPAYGRGSSSGRSGFARS